MLRGRHLLLGGANALKLVPGDAAFAAYEGDLSSLIALNLPKWFERHLYEPGAEIAEMTDWTQKLAAIVQRTRKANITLIAGIPSWLLAFAETMRPSGSAGPSRAPSLQQTIWPNLECIVHGGVPLGPFRRRELRVAPTGRRSKRLFTKVYPASEGFIAAPGTATPVEGLLGEMTDAGLFFEFLPMKYFDEGRLGPLGAHAVSLESVKANEDYALVLTTPGGLCRYVVGDVVRFVSTTPPRLIYAGRTGLSLNAFGERVIEKELTDALLAVCSPSGWIIAISTWRRCSPTR